MRHEQLRALLAIAACAASWPDIRGARADSRIDYVEHIFGATNINAVTGHGRLSVAISADGEVTMLAWPDPSCCDQLTYATSNDYHARSLPHFGAPDGAGMFLGLLVEHADASRQVVWLRDRAVFSTTQDYGPTDGPNPVTVHRSTALGLAVTVVDAVNPRTSDDADLFARDVTIAIDAGSSVRAVWLLTYANLAPMPPSSRVPKIPVVDWAYDGRNDFAAVWDARTSSVVHFHPQDQRVYTSLTHLVAAPGVAFGPIGALLSQSAVTRTEVAAQVAALDTNYREGAYLALTTVPAPDQHQVGFDTTPMCDLADRFADNFQMLAAGDPNASIPVPADVVDLLRCQRGELDFRTRDNWQYTAQDAYLDAQDGTLSGSDLAAGEVNAALRTPVALVAAAGGMRQGRVSVMLGAGANAATAKRAVASATSVATIAAAAEAAVTGWLADKRLPMRASADVIRVARRALINVRAGTVADHGAIVASFSRQPPYGLDWPRDGAFFSLMLDVSGQSALAEKRSALYAAWQRKVPGELDLLLLEKAPPTPGGAKGLVFPEGAWEMNYYPDGMIGGVFRFEIDNAGFALWSLVAHAGWATDPAGYLRQHWDSIALGANFLAGWRDPDNRLQALAQEDDNPGYVQTLYGAVTTFGALELASRGARLIGEDGDAERWEARAGELRDAMLEQFWNAADGHFVSQPGVFDPDSHPTGATAGLIWPMTLLPLDDPRIESQLRTDLAITLPKVNLETEGGSYFMKNTLAFNMAAPALSASAIAELGPVFDAILPGLAAQATPGTDHYGEVMLVVDAHGKPCGHGCVGGRADQRVAQPHLWEGTLFYLTALAREDPAALARYDAVLPPSRVPAPGVADGCGCASGGGGATPAATSVIALAIALRRRRARARTAR